MTLTNIKPSTISLTKGIATLTTIESAIVTLEISPKAFALISQMKAILTAPELITEYIQRVIAHPTTSEREGYHLATNHVLYAIRKEQLVLNPMSAESFLDMYMLNPLQALSLYFKEHISTHQVERMNKWGMNVKDLIAIKQHDFNIRFDRAAMQFA